MKTSRVIDTRAQDAELPRRQRRILVAVALLGYPTSVFLWTLAQSWLGLPGLAMGILGLALVPAYAYAGWRIYDFRARLAQAPDHDLDERQVRVRDRAYLEAYRIFAGVTLVAVVGLAILPDLLDRPVAFTYDVAQWWVVGTFLVSLLLPSAVVAWNEPEFVED